MVRGSLLRTLQFLASEGLPVNTKNLLKYHPDFDNYHQAAGLIRRLRTNGIIETKGYKITNSFFKYLDEKKKK